MLCKRAACDGASYSSDREMRVRGTSIPRAATVAARASSCGTRRCRRPAGSAPASQAVGDDPGANLLLHSQTPQEIPLADRDPLRSQDVVGGRRVEIEVRL